jgi:phosphatidate cytidylyltransferase
MALNVSVFKTRALTAIVFVVIMLCGLFFNAISFLILVSIIHFGAWWEYSNLVDKINNTTTHFFSKIGMSITGYAFLLWATQSVFGLQQFYLKQNISFVFVAAGFLLTVVGVLKSKNVSYKSFFSPSIGFLYITLSLALFIHLSSTTFYCKHNITQWLPTGLVLPAFVLVCMWVNDTMAYLVGSFIGKTPLSKISPKKTWEGTIGGILLCGIIVGIAMQKISASYININLIVWIALATTAAILGTIGDLVESKLKRTANVKDSGSFMPGHGGFLDRFDSLLFATPFMWLLFYWLIISNQIHNLGN